MDPYPLLAFVNFKLLRTNLRRTHLLCFVFGFLPFLSACGGGGGPSAASSAENSSAQTSAEQESSSAVVVTSALNSIGL